MSIVQHYFHDLSPLQLERFASLPDLYHQWNERINVISRKDMEHFETHHLLHSLAIAKVIQFSKGTSILDVGTGGGFPGIPLAILFPECEFHLVDSIAKKTKVVQAVVDHIGLTNVRVSQVRVEELRESYDFVVSRAVTRFETFVSWVDQRIHTKQNNPLPNGILSLKGGDLSAELARYRKQCLIYPIGAYFEDPFFETKSVVYYPH